MIALVAAPCPACGSAEHAPWRQTEAEPPAPRGPWSLVACRACDSAYLRPRPVDPGELYGSDYHVFRPGGRVQRTVLRLAAAREARRTEAVLTAPGAPRRIHELGCGTGELLAALARRGHAVSGIEPSAAAAVARSRGLDVARAGFATGDRAAGSVDLVVAAHVLEHVTEPVAFLCEVRRLLAADGRALIKTPVAGSLDMALFGARSGAVDAPYHMFVPSRRAVHALAARAGLEVVRWTADAVPNDYVHGLRRWLKARTGLTLGFMRPANPAIAVPLLPLSLAAALAGRAGRARIVLRRV